MVERDVVLAKVGAIDHCLRRIAGRLRKMVGFRNIAVHEYEKVNPDIVRAIVDHHLDDFRSFTSAALKHFGYVEEE